MSQYQQDKKYPLRQSTLMFAAVTFLLILASFNLYAAKPTPSPLSCRILPADSNTTIATAVTFTGSVDGGANGRKNYSWDFSNGSGTLASSTNSSVSITYYTVCNYTKRRTCRLWNVSSTETLN